MEAIQLEKIVQNLNLGEESLNFNRKSVLRIVNADINYISDLKLDIKDLAASWPLKTNKLKDIFDCTHKLLTKDFSSALKG